MNREKSAENPLKKTGNFLTRTAERIGRRLPFAPDRISPDIVAQQGLLKQFENRFGLTAGILEVSDQDMQRARASWTAYTLVDEGLADDDTVVEMRLLLPEESLEVPGKISRSVDKMAELREILADEYDVCAVPNSHPIMPTKEYEETADTDTVWRSISSELEGFSRQMRLDSAQQDLAVLAITEAAYAKNIFGGQVLFDGESLEHNQTILLHHVGPEPRENLLLPPRTTGILESREFELARSPGQAGQA